MSNFLVTGTSPDDYDNEGFYTVPPPSLMRMPRTYRVWYTYTAKGENHKSYRDVDAYSKEAAIGKVLHSGRVLVEANELTDGIPGVDW